MLCSAEVTPQRDSVVVELLPFEKHIEMTVAHIENILKDETLRIIGTPVMKSC